MICEKCGSEAGSSKYCPNCGNKITKTNTNMDDFNQVSYSNSYQEYNQNNEYQKYQQYQQHPQYPQQNTVDDPGKTSAIASIILSCLSVFGIGGLISSILGIIFGNKYKKIGNGKYQTCAQIGKIIGIISTITGVCALCFIIFIINKITTIDH